MENIDINLSRFLNTFNGVSGFVVEIHNFLSGYTILLKNNKHLFYFSVSNTLIDGVFVGIYSKHCHHFLKNKQLAGIDFIGHNAQFLDFTGLTKLYNFICEATGVFIPLSDDTKFVYVEKIKTQIIKKYKKHSVLRLYKKMKPYYNEFKNDGFKDLHKKQQTVNKTPYITKFGYNLTKFDGEFSIIIDAWVSGGDFSCDVRVNGRTLLELDKNIQKLFGDGFVLVPVFKNKNIPGFIKTKTKTNFQNPRQLNKKLIVKYVEEYKNDL